MGIKKCSVCGKDKFDPAYTQEELDNMECPFYCSIKCWLKAHPEEDLGD